MRYIVSVILIIGLSQCSTEIDRSIVEADQNLLQQISTYSLLDSNHTIQITGSREPGQRLLLLGLLKRSDSGEILPYNAGITQMSEGSYEESIPGQKTSARLSGSVETDSLTDSSCQLFCLRDMGQVNRYLEADTSIQTLTALNPRTTISISARAWVADCFAGQTERIRLSS